MRTPIPQTPKKMSFMHGNFPPIINRTRSDISQGSLGKEEMPREQSGRAEAWRGDGKARGQDSEVPSQMEHFGSWEWRGEEKTPGRREASE